MNSAAQTMRHIAETVVASEFSQEAAGPAALSRPLGELRPKLLVLMGRGGSWALAARALYLASRTCPALHGVTANEDGTFVGLDEKGDRLSGAHFRDAQIALLTELFLLLLQFLGPGMTLAVICDSWPGTDLGHIDLSRTKAP